MIKKTEKLTREYAEKFIADLHSKKTPFNLKIGGEAVCEAFGEATSANSGFMRSATVAGVKIDAAYRILGTAVEVGVTLLNTGNENSPQINSIDFCSIELSDSAPYKFAWNMRRVLYSIGSPSTIYDFAPREEDITRPETLVLEENSGKCSGEYMPYFNCSSQDTEGIIAAIGWSGNWKAVFSNGNDCMSIRLSHPADFYLEAGESIKLPTVLLMPWKRENDGDRDLSDTFVLFRRIMKDYIIPENTKKGYTTTRTWGGATVEENLQKLNNIKKFNIPCDAYGIDAGWYEFNGKPNTGDWGTTVGDWKEDRTIHPHGLEWLSAKARETGAKGFWLWFEFERAYKGAAAIKAHPEYYLERTTAGWESDSCVLNMGDPLAREYIKGIIYPLIERVGITMFRVDFNLHPGKHFTDNDPQNRFGLTELKYYNGIYEFFGDMLRDFPCLIIDNCASGGRRLDYRMCSYSLPVHCRSDYFTIEGDHANGQQAQVMGLSRWLPVHGDSAYSCTLNSSVPQSTYNDRSVYSANFGLTAFAGELSDEEGKLYKKILDEAYIVREYMSEDFYPLTGYSTSPLDWCAYEACFREGDRGVVLAFRRELNKTKTQIFALKGLNEASQYEVKDIDTEETVTLSGKELTEGFSVTIENPRDSKIFLLSEI